MPRKNGVREHIVVFRMNQEEKRLLEGLADELHLKLSDTMRLIVREAAERRGIASPAGPSRRRPRP